MSPEVWWFGRTMSDAPWRLRVHLPAMDENAHAVFAWLRESLIPAVLAAPFDVLVEFVPNESDRPAGDT